MWRRNDPYAGALLLLSLLIGVALLYQFPAIWNLPPQGAHLWRQTDCMAMVWNYKLYDLPFLQPATFNLQSAGGRVAGEFPLFYYLAAQFSHPEWALRWMHTLVFLSGIVGVYFIAWYFLREMLLSVLAALFLFTSPLLVFYGNNFLSDVPAWSIAMIGWAIFLPASKENRLWLQALAFLCFAVAALLKASYALNFVIAFVYQFKIQNSKFKIILLSSYALLLIPVSWYIYAKQYNAENHDTYYFLSIFPVWNMNWYDIGLTGWRMLVSWSGNYFWKLTSILLAAGMLYAFVKNKIPSGELKRLLLISLGVTVLYGLLFFERMKLHEYYYTFFFIFGAFAVISVFALFRPFAERTSFKIFLLVFLALNIFCCRNTIRQKLNDQPYHGVLASDAFQHFLREKGCEPVNSVLSPDDPSVNQSLYWMKRKGYTAYNDIPPILENSRADFLVLSSPEKIQKFKPYLADSLGSFKGVQLYQLK